MLKCNQFSKKNCLIDLLIPSFFIFSKETMLVYVSQRRSYIQCITEKSFTAVSHWLTDLTPVIMRESMISRLIGYLQFIFIKVFFLCKNCHHSFALLTQNLQIILRHNYLQYLFWLKISSYSAIDSDSMNLSYLISFMYRSSKMF